MLLPVIGNEPAPTATEDLSPGTNAQLEGDELAKQEFELVPREVNPCFDR